MNWSIRLAVQADLEALARIELDASATLAAALGEADGDTVITSPQLLTDAIASRLVFIATNENENPVGFVACAELDGLLYIGEIDVMRAFQRQGLGRHMLEHALAEGRKRNFMGAMLTTDRHVPFNAPFYRTVGFVEIPEPDMPPSLAKVIAAERLREIGPSRRVGMIHLFAAGKLEPAERPA